MSRQQKTGQSLLDKVANTPGFQVRPGKGSLAVVRNVETRRQRSIHGLDAGREYANGLKKLREIGWTEELYEGKVTEARQARVERAKAEADISLEELTGRPVYEAPKPVDPKKDPKIDSLLRDIFEQARVLKRRAHDLRFANQDGKVPTGDQVVDLLVIESEAHRALAALAEELRRRGMRAKSLD